MFKHFHSRFLAFASAGVSQEDALWTNRFAHSRHHGKDFREQMFGRGWGDEYRTRRGDIKFLLLEMLSDAPSHGYDLIKAMESRYGGFHRLSPGSVYPTLQMLEDGGYLTSEKVSGKRVYTITEEGRNLLAERFPQAGEESPRDSLKNFVKSKPQEFMELKQAATELASVVMQVARSGKVEEINRVRELLERAKREIYGILAEK